MIPINAMHAMQKNMNRSGSRGSLSAWCRRVVPGNRFPIIEYTLLNKSYCARQTIISKKDICPDKLTDALRIHRQTHRHKRRPGHPDPDKMSAFRRRQISRKSQRQKIGCNLTRALVRRHHRSLSLLYLLWRRDCLNIRTCVSLGNHRLDSFF